MIGAAKIEYYAKLFIGLKPSDILQLIDLAKSRKLEKDELYIKEGDTRKKIAYIESGLIRAYAVKESGVEKTILLLQEDKFVASHHILILDVPARYNYQVLEPTLVRELKYEDIDAFLTNRPVLQEARKYFLRQNLAEALIKIESFIMLSPEERYLDFVEKNPDLSNRVHDKYIASLLGITPVSLSRIRKRISK